MFLEKYKQTFRKTDIRVATGQAKSVFLENLKKVRPSQDFCGQNGQKSVFLGQSGKKSVFLGQNNKMSDFISSNLQNSLISKAFKC